MRLSRSVARTAANGNRSSGESGSATPYGDRKTMEIGKRHDLPDLLFGFRKDNGIRQTGVSCSAGDFIVPKRFQTHRIA